MAAAEAALSHEPASAPLAQALSEARDRAAEGAPPTAAPPAAAPPPVASAASASAAEAGQPYRRAVEEMRTLGSLPTPCAKLARLVQILHTVSDLATKSAERAAAKAGSSSPKLLAADDLAPLIAYVALSAAPPSLLAELELLREFVYEPDEAGEVGYALTTFEVAVQIALESAAADVVGADAADGADDVFVPTSPRSVIRAPDDLGDCPFGAGDVQQRDQNGKLLRRGDHICRQGGVGGKVQHGIYVGDADDRHVIFFKAHRAPGAKGAWSKLGFGSFDEFAGVEAAAGEVYKVDYGEHDPAALVLQRAASRLGEIGCDFAATKGLAFATWCKTGAVRRVPPAQKTFTAASIAEVSGERIASLLSGVVTIGLTTARIATGVAMLGRGAQVGRGVAAAEAAAAGAAAGVAAAGAAVGGAVAGLGGALIGVVVVNKVLQDDARLPPAERKSARGGADHRLRRRHRRVARQRDRRLGRRRRHPRGRRGGRRRRRRRRHPARRRRRFGIRSLRRQ